MNVLSLHFNVVLKQALLSKPSFDFTPEATGFIGVYLYVYQLYPPSVPAFNKAHI